MEGDAARVRGVGEANVYRINPYWKAVIHATRTRQSGRQLQFPNTVHSFPQGVRVNPKRCQVTVDRLVVVVYRENKRRVSL